MHAPHRLSIRRPRALVISFGVLFALLPGVAMAHGVGQPAPTFPGVLLRWELDPLFIIGVLAGTWLYAAGVMRVNRMHPDSRVPRRQMVCFGLGIAALVIALISPMGVYDDDLFSVHMLQHLIIMDVAAPFLLLGAPLTLLMRASSSDIRKRWVLPILHSRVVGLLTFPVFAWTLFTVVLWVSHYSGLYELSLENDWVHRVEHLIYLIAALLFWWQAIGVDPAPWRMPHPIRILYVFGIMPQMAWLGLAFYGADHVIYAHYATLARTWGPSPLIDQATAGVIMWLIGDIISMVWLGYLIARWVKHEELVTQRKDRELDRLRAQQVESGPSAAGGN